MEKLISRANSNQVNNAAELVCKKCLSVGDISDSYFTTTVSALNTSNGTLTTSIGNSSKSEVTKRQSNKDSQRDAYNTGIKYLLRGYACFPSLEGESAQRLLNVVNSFGKINILSYNEETAELTSMYKKLTTEYADDLAKFSDVSNRLNLLNTTNEEFKVIQGEVSKLHVDMDNTVSASKQKKVVMDILNNNLLLYLESMAKVNPATYASLAEDVSRIIEDANIKIRMSLRSKATDEVTPEVAEQN